MKEGQHKLLGLTQEKDSAMLDFTRSSGPERTFSMPNGPTCVGTATPVVQLRCQCSLQS